MHNKNYLQFIASFLIALVLTIPFYITSVYAVINKISVKGSDGVEGYSRAEDFLNFDVEASIQDDTITNNQVILGSNIQFDRCTPSTSNSQCILRFPNNGTEAFEFRSQPFTVNLFKDDGVLDDSKSSEITIDNKPPVIKLSVSQAKFSSQQTIVVNYDVTDFACDDPSCNGKCVGINNIELYTLDGAFKQTIASTTGNCNAKSSISIEPSAFNDGKNSIFAKATDKFGQVSPETSVTFTVDKLAPSILSNSFAILAKGISLNTFSPNKIPVEVLVNISGNDLNPNSVTADLSSLNPSQNLNNAKASCKSVGQGISICKWQIELDPRTGGLKTIVINASDSSGNKESAVINKLLGVDDQGPVVDSLSTSRAIAGKPLAKAGDNQVIAVFDEASGLNADEAFLHVGSSKIKATNCFEDTNWICIWDRVSFGASAKMSIESDTTDILGNAVETSKTVQVTVDAKQPVLKSMDISPVGGITPAFPGFFKIGDKIAVIANVSEDNDVFAVADFSRFITDAEHVVGSCERLQADEHVCTWFTDSINSEASDVVAFNFSDNAGNSLIVTKSLKTFGLENTTVPDFWSNEVSCSPKAIDRSLGQLINQRVFCNVNLKQKSTTKHASTVFIGDAACTGDTSIVDKIETHNTEVGSTSPIIKVTLRKSDFKINNASLSCSFPIFSRIGSSTTVTKNPEIENVKINIGFFNLPLGELGKDVEKKIEDAKDDAKGIFKLIGSLNKLVNIAKKICQIFGIIYNTITAFYTIAHYFKFSFAELQCTNFGFALLQPFCAITYEEGVAWCEAQQAGREGAQKEFSLHGNTFCKLVNCQITFLWGPTVQDYINNNFNILTPGAFVGPRTEEKPVGFKFGEVKVKNDGSTTTYDYVSNKPVGFGRPVSEMMDPRHNLITATLFACLPGIIYGLDKYRQIKCLYADCLENQVATNGLPITACEDLKAFSTCKYIYTEIFAVFPWTAVIDHFLGLIKDALSSPFSALGAGISAMCWYTCPEPTSWGFTACEGTKLLSTMGEVIGNIKNIIDEGFQIREDYCSRLDLEKKEEDKKPTTTDKTKK